jgi:hypothetical protein
VKSKFDLDHLTIFQIKNENTAIAAIWLTITSANTKNALYE